MEDRVLILSDGFLLPENINKKISDISISDFRKEAYDLIKYSSVVIVVIGDTARIIKNRFGKKNFELFASNVGGFVRSRLYRRTDSDFNTEPDDGWEGEHQTETDA